jgi:two-component system, LytTR family, response regulator LytT
VKEKRVRAVAERLKAILCDDEAAARSELRFLLEELSDVDVTGEAAEGDELLGLLAAAPADVVFLDIAMPGLTGIELAEVLATLDSPPAVVFVTAHAHHALEAFGVAALDYLLKPVGPKRLLQTLGRLSPAEAPAPAFERIPVEKGGKKLLLDIGDVHYVMAQGDYSYLFTSDERYLSTTSLTELEGRLDTHSFFRVHRRFLVNLARVKEVVPMYGGTMLLTLADASGTQVPVSHRRGPSLKKALGL